MPSEVREGLYVGDIKDAVEAIEHSATESCKITHILSLLTTTSMTLISDKTESKVVEEVYNEDDENRKVVGTLEKVGHDLKVVRMVVPLRDMERENLLDCLEACLRFIDEGRHLGGVLVHCFAGVSRSASVVVAYLMKSESLSLEAALESLRDRRQSVCPNDGFLEQQEKKSKQLLSKVILEKFWRKLKHCVRIVKLSKIPSDPDKREAYGRGEKILSSNFAANPSIPATVDSDHTMTSVSESLNQEKKQGEVNQDAKQEVYRCKKCRRVVASQENVLSHVPGVGEACFTGKRNFLDHQEPECSSIFVEPLKWMTTVEEGALLGKLSCIGCQARLGNFNWSGIRCSCGSWVTPAFQLHKSRMDACKT